jgi:CRISPR type III-associated protein (TIGR04423 family)
METIKITKEYQGYIWMSDSTSSEEKTGILLKELDFSNIRNPFIIEGQLYDKANRKSYSIKFVDGKYLTKAFDVNKTDATDAVLEKFIANFDGVNMLKFLRYWKPAADTLCEGMNVLQPKELVFIGFDNKKEK